MVSPSDSPDSCFARCLSLATKPLLGPVSCRSAAFEAHLSLEHGHLDERTITRLCFRRFCLVQLKIASDSLCVLGFAILIWTIPARVVQIHFAISTTRLPSVPGRCGRVNDQISAHDRSASPMLYRLLAQACTAASFVPWPYCSCSGRSSPRHVAQLITEEVPFDSVVGEQEGFLVGEASLLGIPEAGEEFGAGGRQIVVAGKLRFG